MVLELKDKLAPCVPVAAGEFACVAGSSAYVEAKAALVSLGYSATEAAAALEAFPSKAEEATAEDLIKHGLRNLAGG